VHAVLDGTALACGGMASRLATPTAYSRAPQRRARQPAAQRPRPDRWHASFKFGVKVPLCWTLHQGVLVACVFHTVDTKSFFMCELFTLFTIETGVFHRRACKAKLCTDAKKQVSVEIT